MAKRKHTNDSGSSDDEAPETFSFGTTKKAAKGEEDAVRQFHAAQKLKQKEKNRAMDRKLKERAADSKGKGKAKDVALSHWEKATKGKGAADRDTEGEGSDGGEDGAARSALEERMARAMREAEEEDSELEGEGSGSEELSAEDVDMDEAEGLDEDDDEESGEEGGELDEEDDEERFEEEGEEDEDEDMSSAEDEDESEEERQPSSSKSLKQNRNYLPDHLFKSALSNPTARNTKITFDDEDSVPSRNPTSPAHKRRRAKRSAKDIVLGSRTVRTLSKTTEAISPAAAKGLPPPRRVQKFIKHSLNLKGDLNKSKTKGWTRRAANLGVMRRNGPAANFVRNG
ncbi:hypothetical protein PYCCODRAFT_1374221 [Trametes coccinea BRFM310]|uniref:Uncharacterized protein n=1 Tax=Trametes coccinea (strain BRFM310) TaxID=1353009 RepID=A0A1Y2IDZ5_TRAC3|nr:hypothetical protein PYCCODRAFT_1374221 [Trametes coccinea BRFM310]